MNTARPQSADDSKGSGRRNGQERVRHRSGSGEAGPKTVSATDARQGFIVLRTRWRLIVFIAGLAGLVLLAVLLELMPGMPN
jgi:hypothetical protein